MSWSCSNYGWDAFALETHCHLMAVARASVVMQMAICTSTTDVEDLVELMRLERILERLQQGTKALLPF